MYHKKIKPESVPHPTPNHLFLFFIVPISQRQITKVVMNTKHHFTISITLKCPHTWLIVSPSRW